ncbi:hypothetical protein SGCZBJ_13270 [Caulobacter zeae]|uniref:Glycosyl transferase family 1 domain-containing protein n=1 Tax=Caulobacter zeae TaxID=2055137 RepID=A0A2N5DGJ6_9CAUL|nr:glycosyltransferase [Caulobacter zeae]PLR25193.1 hypothetical protein SGCZBJ_13270 [Caulobacter zeae]
MTNIVLLTTAWGRKHGGVNAFNEDLCVALAARLGRSGNIYCAVVAPSGQEIAGAASRGVTLIPISKSKAAEFDETWAHYVLDWMKAERPGQEVDWWVGHDVVSGEAALYGARFQGRPALIHHMNYHAYQGLKSADADSVMFKVDRQRALFKRDAVLFGVGPKLQNSCRALSGREVTQLVPGFPAGLPSETSSDEVLRAITFGRLDRDSDRIKQGRLAAAAFGEAFKRVKAGGRKGVRDASLYAVGAAAKDLKPEEDPREIAKHAAGELLTVFTLSYEEDADKLFGTLSSCNLSMMLSLHEGFGLVGWEAIAAETPLIVSRESGLYDLICSAGGAAKGCVRDVGIAGETGDASYRAQDVDEVAKSIVDIWNDLKGAKADARTLKRTLIEKFGCRWEDTATTFLAGLGVDVPPPGGSGTGSENVAPRRAFTRNEPTNGVPRCAELTVDTTQGSTPAVFDLLPELRFGRWGFDVDDLRVTYGLREASLQLSLTGCAMTGARLGDTEVGSPFVVAGGDNHWAITGPIEGGVLLRKALGDEALCAIRCDGEVAHVELNLSCAKTDVVYTFEAAKAEALSVTSERILGIFLDKCLGRANHATGDVSLSRVVLAIGAAQ